MLAARAAVRSEVVPAAPPEQPEPIQLRLAFDGDATPLREIAAVTTVTTVTTVTV